MACIVQKLWPLSYIENKSIYYKVQTIFTVFIIRQEDLWFQFKPDWTFLNLTNLHNLNPQSIKMCTSLWSQWNWRRRQRAWLLHASCAPPRSRSLSPCWILELNLYSKDTRLHQPILHLQCYWCVDEAAKVRNIHVPKSKTVLLIVVARETDNDIGKFPTSLHLSVFGSYSSVDLILSSPFNQPPATR